MTEKSEWIGKWWTPESSEVVCCGVYKYEPIYGNTIELYPDTPMQLINNNMIKVFYGNSLGKKITLLNCDKYFRTQIAIFGERHLKEVELKFKNYEVYISYLNSWATSRAEDQSVKIDENLSIMLLNQRGTRKFKFCYSAEKSYSEFRKDLLHLTNFLSLAVAEGCYYEGTIAYNNFSEPFEIKERRYFGAKDAKINTPKILFNLKDIVKVIGFETAIKNWFTNDQDFLGSFSCLFFVSQYGENLLEFEFLCLAQALDSMTKFYFDEKAKENKAIKNYLPTDEFRKLRDSLLSVVDIKHLRWLKSKLRNSISFRERIDKFIETYPSMIAISDKDNFLDFVVATRNALSHGDSLHTEENTVKKDGDLVDLFYGIKMILTYVMMDILGFESNFISERLKSYFAFENFFKKDFKF